MPVRIDEQLGAALREWCRVRRTTLVLGVFTAFVALVLRWCDESEAVLRFQSDGRFDPALENSIGYFACVLNLRLQLHEQDSFIDLLERVTQEYCAACEHADLSYVDTRLPQPGFVRNSSFNWVPRASASSSASTSAPDAVTFRPFEFALPTSNQAEYDWDYEPSIVLFDKGEVIEGRLLFCPERHRVATIEAFRNGLLTLIAELLRDAEQPVQSVALPRK